MSRFSGGRNLQLGIILVITVMVFAGLIALRPDETERLPDGSAEVVAVAGPEKVPGEVREARILHTAPQLGPITVTTTTAALLNPAEAAILGPLEGFIIDDLSGWTSIPDGYISENMKFENGGITLAEIDRETSTPTIGYLISPPLPLRQPAMSAPARRTREVPQGGNIMLQVSLSADGETWTSWKPARMHQPPDGNLVSPPVQPFLAPGAMTGVEFSKVSANDSETSGPQIQYRLTLEARDEAPVVRDVRAWRHRTE